MFAILRFLTEEVVRLARNAAQNDQISGVIISGGGAQLSIWTDTFHSRLPVQADITWVTCVEAAALGASLLAAHAD